MGFERLRFSGLSGARDEVHLAAICRSSRAWLWPLIRPPPEPVRVSCVALVGGVGVKPTPASPRSKKPDQPTTCHIKRGAKLTALSADFSTASVMSADGTLDDPSAKMKRA